MLRKKKKINSRFLQVGIVFCCFILGISCKKDKPETTAPVVESPDYFELDFSTANQLEIKQTSSYEFNIITTGSDPYIQLKPLQNARKNEELVLTFDYKSSSVFSHFQVFFGAPVTEERSLKTEQLSDASSWRVFSLDIGDDIAKIDWGKKGDFLRFDFGDQLGLTIDIRNIRLRERTDKEKQEALERALFRQNDDALAQKIDDYLRKSYPAQITHVSVDNDWITIRGSYPAGETVELVEKSPYHQIVSPDMATNRLTLGEPVFEVKLERYIDRDGFRYDRALSRWMILRMVAGGKEQYSHARYADNIQPKWSMAPEKPRHRKGLGGYDFNRGYVEDLDELDIASATVNIPITSFMYLNERANAYDHHYGGKTYYFDRQRIDDLDNTLRTTASRNITVAAIILVQKKSESVDPLVGDLLQDMHYTNDAFFTMPRMDDAERVNCYAAALDFLANRYSRPGSPNGRIHHWIMHNEIDIGSTWTSMGKGRPLHVYLDRYYTSMRLCYNIARQYDDHAEVLASFTHSWAQNIAGGDYATRDMLDALLSYSNAEGDFEWGIAYHSYPQDLNEPKTWNDDKAVFDRNSPLVTFKNLEVLDKWIKQSENMFQRQQKRTLWLSENGTNSRSYTELDLLEQAAGFAYAWKKMAVLDGIDAIQWHNWVDNRHEFGLRIGLRKYPDEATDPGGKKPVWHAYQAAGTANEDVTFEQYKSIIGINSWTEIIKRID